MAFLNSNTENRGVDIEVSFGEKGVKLNLFKWTEYLCFDCNGDSLSGGG